MTSDNDSHSSDGTSSANRSGGKKFPDSGAFDLNEWAVICSVTPQKIRDWIKEFHIPHWGPSQKCVFIDAEDFRGAFDKKVI